MRCETLVFWIGSDGEFIGSRNYLSSEYLVYEGDSSYDDLAGWARTGGMEAIRTDFAQFFAPSLEIQAQDLTLPKDEAQSLAEEVMLQDVKNSKIGIFYLIDGLLVSENTLQTVCHILKLAEREWMDKFGMTWVAHAPKIKLLREDDKKEPYPLSWQEQARLFNELPPYLAKMALCE